MRSATGPGPAAWFVCFSIAMIDGFDTLLMSFLAPVICSEMDIAPEMFRSVFTATYAGAACGAAALGTLADRYGRKPMLHVSLALAGVFTAAAACAHSLDALVGYRALAGLGLGGAIPIISAIAAEGIPHERRRAAVTRVFIGYPVGAITGGLLSAMLMQRVGWRGLMLATGAVASTLLCLIPWTLTGSRGDPSRQSPVAALFAAGRGSVALILGVSAFLILGVSYFLVSWIPTVLTLGGASAPQAAAMAVLLNVGGLLGAWLLSRAAQTAPARAVAISLCVGAILIGTLGVALRGPHLIAASAVFCVGLLVIGAQINIPALAAWLYPARSGASGVGLAMACGRVGSIVGPWIGGLLLAAHLSWESLFLTAAVPALLAGLALLNLAAADTQHR